MQRFKDFFIFIHCKDDAISTHCSTLLHAKCFCSLTNSRNFMAHSLPPEVIQVPEDSVPRRFAAEHARGSNVAQRQPANTRLEWAQEMGWRGGENDQKPKGFANKYED